MKINLNEAAMVALVAKSKCGSTRFVQGVYDGANNKTGNATPSYLYQISTANCKVKLYIKKAIYVVYGLIDLQKLVARTQCANTTGGIETAIFKHGGAV
jgi:hypothetical protein